MDGSNLAGTRLGKYQLHTRLGGGGMGDVYKGYDPTLDRFVAVKVLLPHLMSGEGFVERFLREARSAARLRHPNIVTIHEVGQEGNWYYFAMEFLEGQTLAEFIRQRGPMPVEEALHILRPLAEALDYAHGQGLVHRDIKPGNVIVGPGGRVTLTDFGIARPAQETRLTRTGEIMGTPEYMSPEQAKGGEVDRHSDQYALGVVAYEMLAGRVPFQAESTPALLHKIVYEPVPPLRKVQPNLPVEVERALVRALAKEPGQRHGSCVEFVSALEKAAPAPQAAISAPRPRHTALWIGLGGMAGILILGLCAVVMLWRFPLPKSFGGEGAAAPSLTPTRTPHPTVTPSPLPPPTTPAVPTATPIVPPSPDQVFIPAGTFIRGSTRADIQAVVNQLCSGYMDPWCQESSFEDELTASEMPAPKADVFYVPSHDAHLDGFYIDRYEVTNVHYALCVEAGACTPPVGAGSNPRHSYFTDPQHAQHPVVYVRWYDAQSYCAWVGGRLPTAAEWEKAARGADGRWWPWGNQSPTTEANFRRAGEDMAKESDTTSIGGDTAPVGSYPADCCSYGVMDLAGNVMEWVDDEYGSSKREIRGGSWNTGSFTLRAASRTGAEPSKAFFDVGFRCARDAEP